MMRRLTTAEASKIKPPTTNLQSLTNNLQLLNSNHRLPISFKQFSNNSRAAGIILIVKTIIMTIANEGAGAGEAQAGQENKKPNGWQVDTEMDHYRRRPCKRELFVDTTAAAGAGRANLPADKSFGEENNTSAANDKNNPSQYAGNTKRLLRPYRAFGGASGKQ